MSISPTLDIARRALIAQETALAVVGHNIANVDTPGYTRQVPEFEAEPGRPVGGNVIVGGGATVTQVVQVTDPLLARRRLAAETDQGEQSALSGALHDLDGVVNDLSQPSLSTALDGFFDAADALGRNPQGLAEREALLGRAANLATALNRRSDGIAAVQRATDDRLLALATQTNTDLAKIADLNRVIVATELDGGKANDLRDARQAALNDLAGKIGITAVEDARGAVTVSSVAGPVLVADNAVVHQVTTRPGAPGLDATPLHDLGLADATGAFIDVPAVFTTGTVGGLLAARDTVLVAASTSVDTVAGALRDAANAIQTDPAARDLDGNATTTAPLFTGTGAHDIQVAITDPRRIAAALSADPADNQNALRLADLRTASPVDVAPASAAAIAVGSTSLAGYLATELGRVGDQVSHTDDALAAGKLLAQQLESQRASLSGVNLNEELTDLLKYQRSFQAAAQLLNVTNAVLDDLLRLV